MALYVFDAEMRIEFRCRHRRQVQRDRAKKRRERAEKARYVPTTETDRQWQAAIDRERD